MDELTWLGAGRAHQLFPHACTLSERKARLLLCACARRVFPVLKKDPDALELIALSEQYVDRPDKRGPPGWATVHALVKRVERALSTHRATHSTSPGARHRQALCTVWCAGYSFVSSVPLSTFEHASAVARLSKSGRAAEAAEASLHLAFLRDIFGNPFRPVAFDPSWRTEAVVALARGVYDSRDFAPLPVLADALEDAGCADADILSHCRGPGPHARGCWAVDLVLGKA